MKLSLPLLLLVTACDVTSTSEPVLDISRVEMSGAGTDHTIRAFDGTGAEVGVIRVRHGEVTLEDRVAIGREMIVDAGGLRIEHRSEGFSELALPLFSDPERAPLTALLSDARVQTYLATSGIGFDLPAEAAPQADTAETPQLSCTYATCQGAGLSTLSCTQGEDPFWVYWTGSYQFGAPQTVCCTGNNSNQKTVAERRCGYQTWGVSNPCGTEGGGGCSVCWVTTWSSSCSTHETSYYDEEYGAWLPWPNYSYW